MAAPVYGEYNTTKNPMSKKGANMTGSSPMASGKNNAPATTITNNMYQTGTGKTSNISGKNSQAANNEAVNSSHHSANYRTGTDLNSSQGGAPGAG